MGKTLLNFFEKTGIDVKQFCLKCFDGARDMQSQKKDAILHILIELSKEPLTRCCSHNLQLTISFEN